MADSSNIPPESSLEQYHALLHVSKVIAEYRDLTELLRELAQTLPRIVPLNIIGLVLYVPERHVMKDSILQANVPHEIEGGKEWAVDAHPAGEVWRTQQPLIIDDLLEETRFPQVIPLMREDRIRSLCVVPLTTSLRRLGALVFASTETGTYTQGNLELFHRVGSQVALAVDNVLHYQDLVQEHARLQLLLEVNNAVVSTLELDDLFRTITPALRRVIPHEVTSLYLPDAAGHGFRRHVLDFPSGKGLLKVRGIVAFDETPAGEAYLARKPVQWDATDLQRYDSPTVRHLLAEGVQSGCCVPLLSHGRALGVLNVGSLRELAVSQADVDLLAQVAGQIAIALENALAYEQIKDLKEKLEKENVYLRDEIRTEQPFEEIVGESQGLKRVLEQLEIVAPTGSTVLVLGETGTGKELIARALHSLSERRERPFVKLNCAAIPSGLLESELFGHEKGAFTGAIAQKIGRFESADRGTIFLDEVGEIPLELQSKLLRVLQEQEFERLGGTRTIRVDVRLVAATNRDLARMVENQTFRSDLYYRLNVFPLTVPPLRERPEDIPVLVRYFAQRYAQRMNKRIETVLEKTMDALRQYHWPGNIRELENLMERAVILSRGPELAVPLAELKPAAPPYGSSSTTLEATERAHILQVLKDANWVIGGSAGAAARLGMKRTTLLSRMKKLGISRPPSK